MKRLLIAIVVVVAVLVLVIGLLPMLINVDSFRPEIEQRLDAALGRKVTLGHLDLSIWRGDLNADDITISDDPAFSKTPFLHAKAFAVGVDVWPLIGSHVLNVRSITVMDPEVSIWRSNNGKWNFSSLGQSSSQASPAAPSSGPGGVPDFTIEKLAVTNGRVTIGSPVETEEKPSPTTTIRSSQTYYSVNISAENVSPKASFPFKLDGRAPEGGTLSLNGKAGPMDAADAAKTPFEISAKVQQVNLAATGVVPAASGVGGTLDFDGTLHSDGKTAHTDGAATLTHLQMVKTGSPATQPVTIHYSSDYNLANQTGQLSQGQVATGKSTISLSGTYDTHGSATALHMKLDGPSIPVEDIEALLPAVGVTLPSGSSLKGGTAQANLAIEGPVDTLVITGPVKLSNATLSGFGLASKLSELSAFTGAKGGSNTVIQLMTTDVRLAPDGIRMDKIDLVVQDLGTLTGSGTVSPEKALNFQMTANLAQAGSTAGLASKIGMGGASGIPFLIEGTANSPQFRVDTKGLVRSGVANLTGSGGQGAAPPVTIGNIVNGILGGKKK